MFWVAYISRWTKLHAFGFHLCQAAIDMCFLELEVGDAVAQQPADAVALLEHRDGMAGAGQLLGASQAGGAGPDNGNGFTGLVGGRLRNHPALLPTLVDNGVFDRLDTYRVIIDVKRTGGFAGCRAYAACELGKIVG